MPIVNPPCPGRRQDEGGHPVRSVVFRSRRPRRPPVPSQGFSGGRLFFYTPRRTDTTNLETRPTLSACFSYRRSIVRSCLRDGGENRSG